MKRLQTFFHQLQSTEQLLQHLKNNRPDSALLALETLKERGAHQDGTMQGIDLSQARLTGATFAKSQLEAINFSEATLIHSYFHDAILNRGCFDGANVLGGNFRSASLQHCRFMNANLRDVNFARADLQHADFQNADLTGVNFWQTNLKGCLLTGAKMQGASVNDVVCDSTTILPDGRAWSEAIDWKQFTEMG